jgi:hypothetical protein
MKLFNFFKKYLLFGAGVAFGAVIATVTTYLVMSVCYGIPEASKILEIQECLQEKINE